MLLAARRVVKLVHLRQAINGDRRQATDDSWAEQRVGF